MDTLDLDKLEKDVRRKHTGRITLENVYVVLLVPSCASVVLLTIIVIIAVIIAVILPSDFLKTILDGYRFFDEVASGWNRGYVLHRPDYVVNLHCMPTQSDRHPREQGQPDVARHDCQQSE